MPIITVTIHFKIFWPHYEHVTIVVIEGNQPVRKSGRQQLDANTDNQLTLDSVVEMGGI